MSHQCLICGPVDLARVSRHSFPKDPARRKGWMSILGLVKKDTRGLADPRLCSDHFSNRAFINRNKLRLKPNAVPMTLEEFESRSRCLSSTHANAALNTATTCATSTVDLETGTLTLPIPTLYLAVTPILRSAPPKKPLSSYRMCLVCGPVDSDLSRHRFPKDPVRRKQWLSLLELADEGLGRDPRLCCDHFHNREFKNNKRLRLKNTALPMSHEEFDSKFPIISESETESIETESAETEPLNNSET